MAKKQIPCGGFYYDDTQFEFVDGELKSKGNSGGFDALIVLNNNAETIEDMIITEKSVADYDAILAKLHQGQFVDVKCILLSSFDSMIVEQYGTTIKCSTGMSEGKIHISFTECFISFNEDEVEHQELFVCLYSDNTFKVEIPNN